MNSIKCSQCGTTNWASSLECVRCKLPLTNGAVGQAARPLPRQDNRSAARSKTWLTPLIVVIWLSGMAGAAYFVFSSRSGSDQAAAANAVANPNTSSPASDGTVQVAVPDPSLGVTPPKLEGFSAMFRQEIVGQNGVVTVNPSSPKTPPPGTKPGQVVWDYEALERRSGLCKSDMGRPECASEMASIRAEIAAREHNESLARQQYCKPVVQGDISVAEPGHYHKFGDEIYYRTKVKAPGLTGVHEEGVGCKTVPSPVPLTAFVYLKWSKAPGGGWSTSSKVDFDRSSSMNQKERKALKKEEIEKERSERWREQGLRQASKATQQRAFKALNE